jgi:hypothetical protein
MVWDIELAEQVEHWLLDKLEDVGPTLGRPAVDRIKGSRHHNIRKKA